MIALSGGTPERRAFLENRIEGHGLRDQVRLLGPLTPERTHRFARHVVGTTTAQRRLV